MTSLSIMIERIHALAGTSDLTEWEHGFEESIWTKTAHGKNTTSLSDKQVEIIEKIFKKHFGD
jgi:hypothetical protein